MLSFVKIMSFSGRVSHASNVGTVGPLIEMIFL
jgi:hypothetical protein